jgi:hypothetical protein
MSEPEKKELLEVSCVDCKAWACFPDVSTVKKGRREPPPYCPSNAQREVCEQALTKYTDKTLEFARSAALIENACYAIDANTGTAVLPMVTLHPRAEEIIMLAKVAVWSYKRRLNCIPTFWKTMGLKSFPYAARQGRFPKRKFA